MQLIWKDEEGRKSAFEAANAYFDTLGMPAEGEMQKWTRKQSKLKHSFLAICRKDVNGHMVREVYAVAQQGRVLGEGTFGRCKLIENEQRDTYVIKIIDNTRMCGDVYADDIEDEEKGQRLSGGEYEMANRVSNTRKTKRISMAVRQKRERKRQLDALIKDEKKEEKTDSYQKEAKAIENELAVMDIERLSETVIAETLVNHGNIEKTYFIMKYKGEQIDKVDMSYRDVYETIKAVNELHKNQGVVHADLKPENITILKNRGGVEVNLLDFGVSTKIGEENSGGTEPYKAEELDVKGAINTREVDIYALGKTIVAEQEGTGLAIGHDFFQKFNKLDNFGRRAVDVMCYSSPEGRPALCVVLSVLRRLIPEVEKNETEEMRLFDKVLQEMERAGNYALINDAHFMRVVERFPELYKELVTMESRPETRAFKDNENFMKGLRRSPEAATALIAAISYLNQFEGSLMHMTGCEKTTKLIENIKDVLEKGVDDEDRLRENIVDTIEGWVLKKENILGDIKQRVIYYEVAKRQRRMCSSSLGSLGWMKNNAQKDNVEEAKKSGGEKKYQDSP